MRRASIVVAILGVLLLAVPVSAQSNTIEIFLAGVVSGDPGEVFLVHTETVDPGLVGATCEGFALTQNNESAHPNNDLIIATGGTSAEIADFEEEENGTTTMAGTVTLGESISVSIRLGGDGVSSEGVFIVLTCEPSPPETTTTTAPPPPTTAPPPPTTTPTDTTEPPPEGGVSAGGGATAGRSGEAAMLWLGGGALALLGGATVLAMRRTAGRE